MPENAAPSLQQLVSAEALQDIDNWIAKYPANERQSAVMSALLIVQNEKGFLSTDSMNAVADYLNMPRIAVYEVATFYTMYNLQPVGKHVLEVCTNISCQLRGSAQIMAHLESRLGIRDGETTEDGCFTLKHAECLGACVNAPMMQVGRVYHENLTPERIDSLLASYREGREGECHG